MTPTINEESVREFKERRRADITVSGKPLRTYINEKEEKERESRKEEEVKEERKEIKKEQDKARARRKPKVKWGEYRLPPSERHGVVYNLCPDEIRRRYGIMSKPYNTRAENIIWLINEKGPINSKAIARELNATPSQISPALAGVCNALADVVKKEPIDKEKKGKGFMYSFTRNLIVPEAYEQVKQYERDRLARSKAKKGVEEIEMEMKKKALREDIQKDEAPVKEEGEKDLAKELEEKAEVVLRLGDLKGVIEAARQKLDVNVRIEGSVKILFGFDFRKE